MIFESSEEIFFRRSTNSGLNWDVTKQISVEDGSNFFPSVTERSGYVYAAWQRQTGTSIYDILYSYSTNGGSTWLANPATIVSGVSCPAPGPQPVILAGTPSNSFELMIVYRDANGLRSTRSTSYPIGGNWSTPIQIAGTNSSSQNHSLTYRSNSYGYYKVVWDENSKIYHENYYPDSWSGITTVNSGTSGILSDEKYPSVAVTQSNDIHIAWQGTDYNGKGVVVENKNLSTVYTLFSNSNPSIHYYKPSISGGASGQASLFWHDNARNVWKTTYNGSPWTTPITIGSNGINPSASIMNPVSADARAVWTEGTTSPYTLRLDGMGSNPGLTLADLEITETNRHRRVAVRDTASEAHFLFQITELELRDNLGMRQVAFTPVNDTSRYSPSEIITLLESEAFVVSPGQNVIVSLDRSLRGRRVSTLANTGRVRFQLVNVATGEVVASFAAVDLIERGDSLSIDDRVSFAFNVTTSTLSRLRARIENFILSNPAVTAGVVNVFIQGSRSELSPEPAPGVSDHLFLSVNYPNPFNPSTQIRYGVPRDANVTLKVYNMLGQEIATLVDEFKPAGVYTATFDAKALTSGVYFFKLQAGVEARTGKMMVVK